MENVDKKFSRRRFLRLAAISYLIAELESSGLPIDPVTETSVTKETNSNTFTDEETEFLRKVLEQNIHINSNEAGTSESQPYASSLEYRNPDMYNEVYDGNYLEALSSQLDYEYSPYLSQINPAIKNIRHGVSFDFNQTPEILEARKIEDVHERVLKIVSILAPCTKEELKIRNILIKSELMTRILDNTKGTLKDSILLILRHSRESNIAKNPERELLEEKLKILKSIREKYNNQEKATEIFNNFATNVYGNPAWNDEHISFCNLYASLLIDALELGHRAGHRVDNNGNIVRSGGRELNASGMYNWFKNHGERHGWKNVSNLTYGEKVKLLEEGYIFYGSSPEHNYIISGIRINGRIRPFLTQATANHTIKLFNDFSDSATSYRGIPPSQINLDLAGTEKLMPSGSDYQLFAIHIDDSKNPPIRY